MIAIHVIGCCGFVDGCFWVIAIIHVIGCCAFVGWVLLDDCYSCNWVL
jgi:hypothetical protein